MSTRKSYVREAAAPPPSKQLTPNQFPIDRYVNTNVLYHSSSKFAQCIFIPSVKKHIYWGLTRNTGGAKMRGLPFGIMSIHWDK